MQADLIKYQATLKMSAPEATPLPSRALPAHPRQ